jgi:serine/threonine protein kinase
MKNIESVNASTPHQGCTIRYCAPELLDVGNAVKDVKRKPMDKSDVYSLSMVIVEVWLLCGSTGYSGSDRSPLQLATGRMPYPDYTDHNVTIAISKGKRPSKPTRFEAPGITSRVWKVARKCWHKRAKERLEAKPPFSISKISFTLAGAPTTHAPVRHGRLLIWGRGR